MLSLPSVYQPKSSDIEISRKSIITIDITWLRDIDNEPSFPDIDIAGDDLGSLANSDAVVKPRSCRRDATSELF